MASPPFNIAETVPGDTDIASQYPLAERTFRDIVESWILINHDTNGQHKYVELIDQGSNGLTFAATIQGLWQNGGLLTTRLASGTLQRVLTMPPGTAMIFAQPAPPAGWTMDFSRNDRVLRLVNGGSGGSVGGDWQITGLTTQAHVLSIAEMPAHTHQANDGASKTGQFTGPGANGWGSTTTSPTTSTGGGAAHDHGAVLADATWRPAYLDIVLGVLN